MPDLDTTMLSLFGLGQGAYLAKKAAVASGAADAKPAKDSKVFKLGVNDKEVIEIKKALNKIYALRGGDALDETSDYFDEKTTQKVIDFQNEKKLSPADGTVDAKTLDKLLKG
jgi:peptidoglycan hydrolase-like protein with peptidoglycan-binding domain